MKVESELTLEHSLSDDEPLSNTKLLVRLNKLNREDKLQIDGKNVLRKRYLLHSRKQVEGEYFDNYYKDLQFLFKLCEFTDDSVLRDHVVFGIKDSKIRNKLLGHNNPSLESVVEICRSGENKPISETENVKRETKLRQGFAVGVRESDSPETKYEEFDQKDEDMMFPEVTVEPLVKTEPLDACLLTTTAVDYALDQEYVAWDIGQSSSAAVGEISVEKKLDASSKAEKHPRDEFKSKSNRIFECNICNKILASQGSLYTHMLTHTGEKRHKCHLCNRGFALGGSLRKHLLIHTGEKSHMCPICKKGFRLKSSMKRHIITHVAQNSDLPDELDKPRIPKTSEQLEGQDDNDGNTDVKDEFNESEVSVKKNNKYNPKIKGARLYRCDVCGYRFKTKSFLREHKEKHAKRPHTCNICSRKFPSQSHLDRHTKYHNKFPCYCCDEVFERKQHLKYHMLKHADRLTIPDEPRAKRRSTKSSTICTVCNKNYSSKTALTIHMVVHTGERKHQCHICSKFFTQRSSLNIHLGVHETDKPHRCEICNKTFSAKDYLKKHALVHTGELPYSCDQCGRRFRMKPNLNQHMLLHKNERIHQCEICRKSYTTKYHLKKHMNYHIRPHKCDVCSKGFAKPDKLRKHMSTHQR